jgi:hypothetical protein
MIDPNLQILSSENCGWVRRNSFEQFASDFNLNPADEFNRRDHKDRKERKTDSATDEARMEHRENEN